MFEFLKNIIQPKKIKEPGDIKFKDCIRSISAKHGSRGSLLQNLLVSYGTDDSQYYGVIGWLANDRKQSVKGEDYWKREGQLKK